MAVPKAKHYLWSFNTVRAPLEKIMRSEKKSRHWDCDFGTQDRKRGFVLNLGTHKWLLSRLKRSLLEACSTKKIAAWDALLAMLSHSSLLSQSESVSEVALEHKRKQNRRSMRTSAEPSK